MSVIRLKLINAGGVPNEWPGVVTETDPALMGDPVAVWVGVSLDGSTNQVYPIDTPLATIKLTFPRIYQGTQVDVDGSTNAYTNNLRDVDLLLRACCIWTPPTPIVCDNLTITFNEERPPTSYILHIFDQDGNEVATTNDTSLEQLFPALDPENQYRLCVEVIDNLGRTDVNGDVDGGPLSYGSFPDGCGEGSLYGVNCVFTIGPGQG